ncbi:MAG: CdaR family protein [Sphaerochaetaceae bacterium]|nr:CdaR family protein [Sphaerochaetaceae bacterium]
MKTNSILHKLLSNWPMKLSCLIFAVCLVFIVRFSQYRNVVAEIPLQLILPEGYSAQNKIDEKVELTIEGDSKMIYLINPMQVEAIADFSGVSQDNLDNSIKTQTPLVVQVDLVHDDGIIDLSEEIMMTSNPSRIKVLMRKDK